MSSVNPPRAPRSLADTSNRGELGARALGGAR